MVWSIENLPNLSGKIAIVTGASSGIGLYATQHLARVGAKVILAVRNVAKGERVADEIRTRLGNAKNVGELVIMEVDVSKMDSVKTFASTFMCEYNRLDILINNAGVMMLPEYKVSADGYEMHYATNYLGEFMLTGLLLKVLEKTAGSRVVNVTSLAHKFTKDIDYDMMSGRRAKGDYRRMAVYSETKLANLFFTYELARRVKDAKKNILVVAAHPGWARTSLQDQAKRTRLFSILNTIIEPIVSQDSEQGSLPLLMAATDPEAQSCDLYAPGGLMELKGRPKKVNPAAHAKDEEKAKKMWNFTEKLLDMRYNI